MHIPRAISRMCAALSSSGSTPPLIPHVFQGQAAAELLRPAVPEPLSSPGHFQEWLRMTADWKARNDPSFRIAMERRDIRRKHRPELDAARDLVAETRAAYAPFREDIEVLERQTEGKRKELENRRRAFSGGGGGSGGKPALSAAEAAAKEEANAARAAEAEAELGRLEAACVAARAACAPLAAYSAACAALEDLEHSLGLRELSASLARAHVAVGAATRRSGGSFEDLTRRVVESALLPSLASRHGLLQAERGNNGRW